MLWHFETQLKCNNSDVVHARHPSKLHIIDEDLSLCSSGLRLPYENDEFLNTRKVQSRKHRKRKKITRKDSKELKDARGVLDLVLSAVADAGLDAVAVADFLANPSVRMIYSPVTRGLWIEALFHEFPTLKEEVNVDLHLAAFQNAVLGLQKEELDQLRPSTAPQPRAL